MKQKLDTILKIYLDLIPSALSLKQLDKIFLNLFGKNGELTLFPKEFPQLEKAELRVIAPLFKQTKSKLEELINERRQTIKEDGFKMSILNLPNSYYYSLEQNPLIF